MIPFCLFSLCHTISARDWERSIKRGGGWRPLSRSHRSCCFLEKGMARPERSMHRPPSGHPRWPLSCYSSILGTLVESFHGLLWHFPLQGIPPILFSKLHSSFVFQSNCKILWPWGKWHFCGPTARVQPLASRWNALWGLNKWQQGRNVSDSCIVSLNRLKSVYSYCSSGYSDMTTLSDGSCHGMEAAEIQSKIWKPLWQICTRGWRKR